MTPARIQRKRTRGWMLAGATSNPNGAVIVSRPSRFGNPFTFAMAYDLGYAQYGDSETARRACAGAFTEWLGGNRSMWQSEEGDARRARILVDLHLLRGKDLACTCPLPEPGQPDHCHAVELLRLANSAAGVAR